MTFSTLSSMLLLSFVKLSSGFFFQSNLICKNFNVMSIVFLIFVLFLFFFVHNVSFFLCVCVCNNLSHFVTPLYLGGVIALLGLNR